MLYTVCFYFYNRGFGNRKENLQMDCKDESLESRKSKTIVNPGVT